MLALPPLLDARKLLVIDDEAPEFMPPAKASCGAGYGTSEEIFLFTLERKPLK